MKKPVDLSSNLSTPRFSDRNKQSFLNFLEFPSIKMYSNSDNTDLAEGDDSGNFFKESIGWGASLVEGDLVIGKSQIEYVVYRGREAVKVFRTDDETLEPIIKKEAQKFADSLRREQSDLEIEVILIE